MYILFQLIQDLFQHHDRKNHLRTTVELSKVDEMDPEIPSEGLKENSGSSLDEVKHSEIECQTRYGHTKDSETIDVQAKRETFDQADDQTKDYQPLDANKSHPISSDTMEASKNSSVQAAAGSGGVDPHCEMCALAFRDPQPHELVMYLHAYHYAGPGWSFSTSMPHWAIMPTHQ
jgi:hypothetical protein